jgi:hypothetical protein
MHFDTIDIDFLDFVTGGADSGDLCPQAMVTHLTGGTPSPEGVAACAKQGITLGHTSAADLPSLPKPTASPTPSLSK